MASSPLLNILQDLQLVVYVGMAIAAFVQWRRRPSRAGAWLGAAFGSLAVVSVASQLLPDDSTNPFVVWGFKAMLVILVLFPYFLYRFMIALVRPVAWIKTVATALTVVAALASFFLPSFEQNGTQAGLAQVVILLLVTQWVLLTGRVAVRLWGAGRGLPTLTRRRMRTMSLGAAGLALVLVVASGDVLPRNAGAVAIQVLALTAGPLMLIGFAPPYVLRVAWRRKEETALREAELALAKTTTTAEVLSTLLPHARRMIGAASVVMRGAQGKAIASDGQVEEDGVVQTKDRMESVVSIPMDSGQLVAITNPFTPFFGNEEVASLKGLAALADLAITRNTAFEEAHRANQAKNDFLSRMSHELRTPFNAILGFAQLLDMDQLTEDQKDWTNEILKAGEHLLQLINEVLDITSIETGNLRLSLEPVNIEIVAKECISLLTPLASEENIKLILDGSGALYVMADRQRVKQVLLNIISNGIKYNSREGSVRVWFEHSSDGNLVEVKVADTGHGVPRAAIERLFSPFDRLNAEESGIEGTGLGLALSKALVEAMGGTISVASEVGKGTAFTVKLAAAEPFLGGQDEAAAETVKGAQAQSQTILHIEDNLTNLKLVEQLLERRPQIRIISAMQGGIGITLARNHRPDLILLDLNLPDMQGEEVLGRLRAEVATADLPVVVITAETTPGQVKRLIEAGARVCLTKPLEVKHFLEVVDTYCRPSL